MTEYTTEAGDNPISVTTGHCPGTKALGVCSVSIPGYSIAVGRYYQSEGLHEVHLHMVMRYVAHHKSTLLF